MRYIRHIRWTLARQRNSVYTYFHQERVVSIRSNCKGQRSWEERHTPFLLGAIRVGISEKVTCELSEEEEGFAGLGRRRVFQPEEVE